MSLFDLKTDVDELASANDAMNRMEYDQHPPSRDVTGEAFGNGNIHFRFETSGQKWWIPNRSYIRTRFKLTKQNGTPVDLSDNIAPNMGMMSGLFQAGEFRVSDKTISRIPDFMPQIDALETRQRVDTGDLKKKQARCFGRQADKPQTDPGE